MSRKNSPDAPVADSSTAVLAPPTTPVVAGNGGALSRPSSPPVSRLQGADSDDLILPRIHIFQGLPAEQKQYGKHESGALINTLTGEVTESRPFTPIFGYKEWIKWKEPRGAGIEYRTRNKEEIAAGDLDWHDDEPPTAQLYINWVVLCQGDDTPVVFSFTKTSVSAGRTINTLEAMRGKKGPGLYAVEIKEKNNDKGTWFTPKIRPAGEPSPELVAAAQEFYESLSGRKVDVDAEGFNPDAE